MVTKRDFNRIYYVIGHAFPGNSSETRVIAVGRRGAITTYRERDRITRARN